MSSVSDGVSTPPMAPQLTAADPLLLLCPTSASECRWHWPRVPVCPAVSGATGTSRKQDPASGAPGTCDVAGGLSGSPTCF